MKVSIIVPAYNVGKYVRRCLESVKAQTIEDWECIVVNDGSTDNTLQEVLDSVSEDDRFMIVSTAKNHGLYAARNKGMALAHGRYVTFLDSDDWLSRDALEIYVAAIERNPDVRRCAFPEINEWEESGQTSVWSIAHPGLHVPFSMQLFASGACDVGHVTGCIYVREGMPEFPPCRRFEDMLLNFEVIFRGEQTYIGMEAPYHYTRRPGSLITAGYTLADARAARSAFEKIVLEYNPPEATREQCRRFMENAIAGQLAREGIKDDKR